MLNQNIVSEATRLTRAGQLVEATALLQRMLRGESAPEPSDSHARVAPARLEPPTIDVKANVVSMQRCKTLSNTRRKRSLCRKRPCLFLENVE